MAQIVLGLGTSHSPQLSTPPDLWRNHGERDKRNPDLRKPDGRVYTYEEVLASASPSLQKELTPDTWQGRYAACQKGIAQVGATLAEVAPDVLVMIGDDQKELFQDNNMPAMLVYWGDTFHNVPRYGRGQNVPPSFPGRAGGYPTGPPTDPDVRNERIRFLGSQSCGTTLAHHCAALHGQIRWCGRSWVWAGQRSATASRTSPTRLPSYYHVGSASTAMLFPHDDAPPPTGGSSPGYHSTGKAPVTAGIASGTGISRARGDWCGTIATATS